MLRWKGEEEVVFIGFFPDAPSPSHVQFLAMEKMDQTQQASFTQQDGYIPGVVVPLSSKGRLLGWEKAAKAVGVPQARTQSLKEKALKALAKESH